MAENYLEGYHVPIAHPGLMRLLDYQRYTVEVGEGYVFFEAPLREKPSANRLERAYQRLVQPHARADRGRSPRLAVHLHLAQHDHGPLSRPGHDVADLARTGCAPPRTPTARYRAAAPSPAMRAVQRLNHRLNMTVAHEDVDLVTRVQHGMATRGWRPGPLGEREAGVRWFAARVRQALADEA